MEHHHQQHIDQSIVDRSGNNSVQWNYPAPLTNMTLPLGQSTPVAVNNNQHNTWTPSTPRGSKRALSESDCDDIYSEGSSKDQCNLSGTDSCQLMGRKKRRGVIEKKRRDRINSSLSELKRLVPSAFEKQGSAKLEKAEILQLTVDHLKSLHSKGIDSSAGFDSQRFAMEYHIIGFRECASEVARYLVSIEGMDIQDPLRLRLLSHLQCFVAQRELNTKPGGYAFQPSYPNQGFQSFPVASQLTPNIHQQGHTHGTFATSFTGSSNSYFNSTSHSPEYSSSGYLSASANPVSLATTSASDVSTSPPDQRPENQPVYADLSHSHDRMPNLDENYQSYSAASNASYTNSKPYRPWSKWQPEIAY